MKNRLTKLEPSYVSAMEDKVVAGLEAAKAKLAAAREANDINAEVDAQKMIAQIGVEETRVAALKSHERMKKRRKSRKKRKRKSRRGGKKSRRRRKTRRRR